MSSITFDTLKFVERLTMAGISATHAKAEVEALTEVLKSSEVASSQDLKDLSAAAEKREISLDGRIDKRFAEVDKRFNEVDKRFDQIDKRFEVLEDRFNGRFTLLQWMITFLLAGQVALVLKAYF